MSYQIERHHGSYNISRRSTMVKYIVVHYTGSGTSSAGSALANCKYFAGGNRNASANYFIDDATICEYADPSTYYTWHCGDGHGKYGISNSNSVGIEVCRSGDVPYTEAEVSRLAWLVQRLMARFGVPASRVVRHYDASRKACPYYYTPSGAGGDAAWSALHARITRGSTEEEEVTQEDIDRIVHGVWEYIYGGDASGQNCYNKLAEIYARRRPADVWEYTYNGSENCFNMLAATRCEVAALQEAVRALAAAQGADPDEVAKAVSNAVAKKLESINISVTVDDKE